MLLNNARQMSLALSLHTPFLLPLLLNETYSFDLLTVAL
jgi:hypothetical protein